MPPATDFQSAARNILAIHIAVKNAIANGDLAVESQALIDAFDDAMAQLDNMIDGTSVTNLIDLANDYKSLAETEGVDIVGAHISTYFDLITEFFEIADQMDDNRAALVAVY